MLDPRAVEAFYKRELDDFRWIKECPREELLKLVPKGFRFVTEPYTHQLACFILATKFPRLLFFLDLGTGKSRVLLDIIRYRKMMRQLRGALVTMPNVINMASWERQISIHAPDLSYRILSGDKASRYAMMDEEPVDVCLINVGGLPVYMADAKRRTKKGKQRRDVVVEDAVEFSNKFSFIGYDEIHVGLSTVTSLQYRLAKMLSWRADFAYGLTGTPMGKDPTKMWPQFHVIDQGETLGHSLAMFRAAYFHEKESYWKGIEYVFDKHKRLHLHKATQHRSIRYTDKEVADMPAVTPIVIPVPMSVQQMHRNEELLLQAKQARSLGETQPATFIRQRQTTAGFIAVKGEDNTKLEVAFSPNPKIDALEEFINELLEEDKLVVFHSYVYSGVLITELLKKMKVGHSGVGQGWKDPALSLRRFLTDPKCRVFVANVQAGGTGVDGLQTVCHYQLFYESPVSPTQRRQAEKRLNRDGQKRRCYTYDLVARGINVDQRVLDSIAAGVDIYESVVNGREGIT